MSQKQSQSAINLQIFNVISLIMPGAPIKDDIFEKIESLYSFAIEKILTSEAKQFKISSTRHDVLKNYNFDIEDKGDSMNVNTFIKKLATAIPTETLRLQSLYCVLKEINNAKSAYVDMHNIEDLHSYYFIKSKRFSDAIKKLPVYLVSELSHYEKISNLTRFAIMVFGEYLIAELFDVSTAHYRSKFKENLDNPQLDLKLKDIEIAIKKDEELSAFFNDYKF